MQVTDYRQVEQCLRETKTLKTVWDMIASVTTLFAEWRKTKWDEIDVEMLAESTRQLAKELRACDKQVLLVPLLAPPLQTGSSFLPPRQTGS